MADGNDGRDISKPAKKQVNNENGQAAVQRLLKVAARLSEKELEIERANGKTQLVLSHILFLDSVYIRINYC